MKILVHFLKSKFLLIFKYGTGTVYTNVSTRRPGKYSILVGTVHDSSKCLLWVYSAVEQLRLEDLQQTYAGLNSAWKSVIVPLSQTYSSDSKEISLVTGIVSIDSLELQNGNHRKSL